MGWMARLAGRVEGLTARATAEAGSAPIGRAVRCLTAAGTAFSLAAAFEAFTLFGAEAFRRTALLFFLCAALLVRLGAALRFVAMSPSVRCVSGRRPRRALALRRAGPRPRK